MTTGRINQVTIPQGTSPPKNPSASASSHGMLPFSTDNLHWQSARPFGPVRPADNHSIFATSLHYSTLVSFGHTSATTKSMECPEHTSGKNAASSESHCLSLAKGHHVQHPSVLSWPLGHFLLQCGHFMLSEGKQVGSLTRSLNIAAFCPICHSFVPGNILPSRAYSYGPNTAQLLFRSFSMPALTLLPEIVYSPVRPLALGKKFFSKNLRN